MKDTNGTIYNIFNELTNYIQWRFYVKAAMGTALPPPSLMVRPLPSSCIGLSFVCPSIIAQVQLGQIKGVDGCILHRR